MSVVNAMLRDLEARGTDERRARIPVKKTASRGAGNYRMAAGGTVLAVVAVVAWQWQLFPDFSDAHDIDKAQRSAPVVAAAAAPRSTAPKAVAMVQTYVAPPVRPADTIAVAEAMAQPPRPALQASWQWSNEGFALQLDGAADLRYGIERVDARTLKISLAHAALKTLEVPSPAPRWIENLRIQRDDQQQFITVQATSRLEYDVAALADAVLVLSVWRGVDDMPVSAGAAYSSGKLTTDAVDTVAPAADRPSIDAAPVSEQQRARATAAISYSAPRIERTALTPQQRDAKLAAEAAADVRAGHTARAITALRKSLESSGAAPQSAALLVTLLMSQQRLAEATPYLERALHAAPSDAALLKLKARMLAMQGEPERARDVLASLQPLASRDTELLALSASLSQQAHDYAAAAASYLQWTRIDPASGSAWYGLALALDAQASPPNAVAAYRQALTLISDARLRDYANARIRSLTTFSAAEKPVGDHSDVNAMPRGTRPGAGSTR